MIAKCKRTATVKSLSYITVAELSQNNFNKLIMEFPEIMDKFRTHLFKYRDPNKLKHMVSNL